jgi:hypothetical protein
MTVVEHVMSIHTFLPVWWSPEYPEYLSIIRNDRYYRRLMKNVRVDMSSVYNSMYYLIA